MEIRFRDVGKGIVAARASIEIDNGILLNEITILKKGNHIEIEYPQKSFRGQDGRIHFVDLITFENEEKRIIWDIEIRDRYNEWRKLNKPISVYDSRD